MQSAMKDQCSNIFALTCRVIVFTAALASSSATQTPAPNQVRAPVVVELFTSEGCSTCPPADELLVRLEEQQLVDGAEVIAIEEHVDYWNHDGWIDPFSALEWTLRQQDYAARFKLDSVYTPQMVIDGRDQFIGNRVQEVSTAIVNNARIPKADVAITEARTAGNQPREFSVSVRNLPRTSEKDSSEVWFAITESGLHSQVKRGENAGKNLQHASIVRWMHKVGVANGKESESSFTAKATVKLKPTWNVENLRAVAFVQERQGRRMVGAASIKISR
jgi:hypothetical protein